MTPEQALPLIAQSASAKAMHFLLLAIDDEYKAIHGS